MENIKTAMEKVFLNKTIQAGSADLPTDNFEIIVKLLSKNEEPWIAALKPSGKLPHTVIVDKVIGENVLIRDPWNKTKGFGADFGVEAQLKITDFTDYWKGTRFYFSRIINK